MSITEWPREWPHEAPMHFTDRHGRLVVDPEEPAAGLGEYRDLCEAAAHVEDWLDEGPAGVDAGDAADLAGRLADAVTVMRDVVHRLHGDVVDAGTP